MGEFQKVLKFICSECGEHEKVYWHWIDFDYKIVNVECVVCTNSAERKVN